MYNSINIPLFIEIEDNGIEKIPFFLKKSNIYINNPLIITDKGKSKEFAYKIKDILNIDKSRIYCVDNNTYEQIEHSEKNAREKKADVIIGVGGGLALDIGKMTSLKSGCYFISVPTLPSHDGIASPIASIIVNNERKSLPAAMAIGIIVDLDIIRNAPLRYIHSGIMDLLSNLSALKDWELAFNKGYEIKFNGFSYAIAYSAAGNILNYPSNDIYNKDFLHLCINSLVLSGIAMEIAGSSRPASGAEHNFSHVYDKLYPDNNFLHGEKVGLGTLIVSYIRSKQEYERMYNCFNRYGLIASLNNIGFEKQKIINAFMQAKSFRVNRYTVLFEKDYNKNTIEHILNLIFK